MQHDPQSRLRKNGRRQPREKKVNTMVMRVLGLVGFVATAITSALVVDAVALDPRGPAQRATARREPAPDINPQALYLVRSTLSALHDANRTGNYSVLRELSAPSFQAAHSAADIAVAFADLRRRGIDLSAALLTQPKLAATQRPEPGKAWQLQGHILAELHRINFDMRFDPVAGHWRLAALTIATADVQQASASGPQK
jgi:hypothetical protein